MAERYDREQRRELEKALARGGPIPCPACGEILARTEVPTPRDLPYVRRRVWLICPRCKRTAAFDVRAGERP